MEATDLNMDIYNSLTMDQLEKGTAQIKEHSVPSDNPLGCILTNYKYDKRPQVRIDGKKYYCSVIIRLYNDRLKYGQDFNISAGLDCSHYYCHNPECVNQEHLHFENHLVNKSRLCCRLYGLHKYGQTTIYNCPHIPRCYICQFNSIKF